MLDKEKIKETMEALAPINLAGHRVAILREESDTVSDGGIIIPDNARKNLASGTVVKMGLGCTRQVLGEYGLDGIKSGDYVTFNAYDGVVHSFKIAGKVYELLALDLSMIYFFTPAEDVNYA